MTPPARRPAVRALVVPAMLALAGCAGPPPAPAADPAGTPLLDGWTVGARLRGASAVPAPELLRPGPATRRYRTGGDVEGVMRQVTTADDAFGGTWATDEDGIRIRHWKYDDDGAAVLTAVVDHSDHAISLFDPPLVMCRPVMEPGRPVRTVSAMRVVDSRNPRRQRESGLATHEVTYVGDRRLETPDGPRRVHQIEIRFRADLRLARAAELSTMYVADGVAVAERRDEQVRLLGAFTRRTRTVLVLDEAAADDAGRGGAASGAPAGRGDGGAPGS
ncbi:MAG: hypothetical protein ACYTG1_09695 [Planctomycetota bacterium]